VSELIETTISFSAGCFFVSSFNSGTDAGKEMTVVDENSDCDCWGGSQLCRFHHLPILVPNAYLSKCAPFLLLWYF
jgi:hypothetical protein